MGKSAIMSVRITGNADDAIKALGKAQAKASAFGSAIGGIATKAVTTLWDKLAGLTGGVADMSDSIDKFKSTMSFAGLDTQAIDQATKDTRAYADQTVYDLGTVQNTTAQLAANGIHDYTRLTEAAGNLNAVAGGNADTFNSVAMVLTQTAGAGKLTTENWNQLADAIPGASGQLQAALQKNGAYTGNFRDAMAKGEITADEFNQAILDLGFTDAAQQAATSTSTIEGAVGNLQAAINGGLSDLLTKAKPAITSAISWTGDTITNAFAWIGQAYDGLSALLLKGDFTQAFAQAFDVDEDSPAIDAILTLRDKFTDLVHAFQENGPHIQQTIQDIASHVGTAFGAIGSLAKSLWDTIGKVLGQFTQAAGGTKSASQTIHDATSAIGTAFDTAADVIRTAAQALTAISDWTGQHATAVSTALTMIAGGLAAFKAYQAVTAMAAALQGFSLASTAASIAQQALNLAMSLNPIGILVTTLGALTAGIIWFVTQTDTGRAAWQAMCQAIDTAWQWVSARLSQAWQAVSHAFSAAIDGIRGAWQTLVAYVQGIPGRITGAFAGIAAWFRATFANVKNGITSGFDTAAEWVTGIPDRIKDVFRDAGQWLKDAGRRIIQGLADGIKGKWDDVKDWFGGVGDWIVQHKGPPSKDATLLTRNGRLIMQGLAKGLDQGLATSVTRSIGRITQTIAGTPLGIATPTTGTQPGMGRASQVSITINGALAGSEDQLAAWIRRALDDYQRRRS